MAWFSSDGKELSTDQFGWSNERMKEDLDLFFSLYSSSYLDKIVNIIFKRIISGTFWKVVKNSKILKKENVHAKWKGTEFLKKKKGESKGWILDIMNCVDAIQKDSFSFSDIYKFEKELKEKYPNNNFIKDKIRQQLQLLRDKGLLEFMSRGKYRKTKL